MPNMIAIRLDETLIKKIRETSKQMGITQKELIVRALNQYFNPSTTKEETPTLKEIITIYKGKCSKCGKIINVGERALWGKTPQGSILICADCQIDSESDKTIVKRLIKRRKLDRQIKALQNQLDWLAQQYETQQFILDHQKAVEAISELHKFFTEYQTYLSKWSKEEEQKKISKMLEKLKQILSILRDFETFYQLKIKAKIKTKRRA